MHNKVGRPVLISICSICMTWNYKLSYYYINNMPNCPNYENGRIYEFNIHGSIVYVTKEEKRKVDWINMTGMLSAASTIILGVIFRRNKNKGSVLFNGRNV